MPAFNTFGSELQIGLCYLPRTHNSDGFLIMKPVRRLLVVGADPLGRDITQQIQNAHLETLAVVGLVGV